MPDAGETAEQVRDVNTGVKMVTVPLQLLLASLALSSS